MQGMLIYRKSLSESSPEQGRSRAAAISQADRAFFYRRVETMRSRGRLIPACYPAE
jgi:hypothetical protein